MLVPLSSGSGVSCQVLKALLVGQVVLVLVMLGYLIKHTSCVDDGGGGGGGVYV